MTPEERALAATQLRNLAELSGYRTAALVKSGHVSERELLRATAESVAMLAEMLATVIEDRADMNEVPL